MKVLKVNYFKPIIDCVLDYFCPFNSE